MLRRLFYTAIGCFALTSIFVSCGSDTSTKTEQDTAAAIVADTAEKSVSDKIIYSLPSPLRVMSLFKKSGGHYIEGIINVPENVSKYTTSYGRALNMGIYGADLAYTALHNQTQASINCLKADKVLAEALGLSAVFSSNNFVKRFENNLSNKDSLLGLVADLYRASDLFLRESENHDDAILIMAGGWIEALYIGTKTYEKNNSNSTLAHIAEQKISLDNLIEMVNSFKEQKEFADLIDELKAIQNEFAKVDVAYEEKETSKEDMNAVVTIGSEASFKISPEQFKRIAEKTADLRSKLISAN